MEYTKDMIFRVHYDEVNHVIRFKNKNRTSYFFEKLKRHKLITISVLLGIIFMVIDGILIMNFIHILETF